MTQHLSIRVPWKDNGYGGLVCAKPCYNNSCLRLKNIAENRDDRLEAELAGCAMAGHEEDLPCLSEGGAFMSPVSYTKISEHPYKKSNPKTHGHFLETPLAYPPFSLPARPFGWVMLRKGDTDDVEQRVAMYNIAYDSKREPELGFKTNWVQDARNQCAIFETFCKNIKSSKSLVIPYAKQVPFIEDDSRRVVMGIGFVKNITLPPEHRRTNEGELRSSLWETMVEHSIREERTDGFLLPYAEMMRYSEEHSEFDMRSITVFAEEDYFNEFSFASEHLSYDAVISVLLQTIKALGVIKNCISGNWDECIAWANSRLIEVWKDRGAFPGAGAMLCAMGFKQGILITEEVKDITGEDGSFIKNLEMAIAEPKKYLSQEVADSVNSAEKNAFMRLNSERNSLFWLFSRLSLTHNQAAVLFNGGYYYLTMKGEKRYREVDIDCGAVDMLKNPYVIFEKTRLMEEELRVPLRCVDMAVFPRQEVMRQDPLPEPSRVSADNDERRVRAIAVSILERQAGMGHTVYPQKKLIAAINELPLDPCCFVSGDILSSQKDFFSPEMAQVPMKGGGAAYQLFRMQEFDEVIRKSVNNRVNAINRHNVPEDWGRIVNEVFDKDNPIGKIGDEAERKRELKAREEKTAILMELAKARLSVLVGGAGTGKTTLLALLCKSPKIQNGGVLLLAPTGKARVRMSRAMQDLKVAPTAKTVAQFLIQNNRFDFKTLRYHLSKSEASDVPETVIIDECSMLTDDMLGTLLQALKRAQRIILVGDPKQLPPIGAGRPFVDLVKHLKKDVPPSFPRVGKSYGELTVTRRQQNEGGAERFDTMLAEWYSDADVKLDSEIFAKLQANECGDNISFKMWNSPEELEQLILNTIVEETMMAGIGDIDGFDLSIGGEINGDWMNFGGKPDWIEKWQILSAYRNNPIMGSATINRYIHVRYRGTESPKDMRKKRKTNHPLGTDGIIYGDKVINIRNHTKDGYPKEDCPNFIANGEVGIVDRIWQKPRDKRNQHQVCFSSQPGYKYNWDSKVSDEVNSDLELAYALTVHKAQGSEFDTVILVIGEPSGLLSKELLYTALTRQKKRLLILYNNEAYRLRNYSSAEFSDIARRFTNLFEEPEIVEFKNRFYEAGLIHKTARGELVRSKSEVIIADALYDSGIDYAYEKELDLGEDGKKSPDFTVEDAESGRIFYWEHCGMMSDEKYRRRWEAKQAVYKKHNIIEGENLLVSYDNENGSIDSQAIRGLIEKYLR
jgi:hypothetical protein